MEYRISKGWRVFAWILCAAFVIGGIALVTSPLYSTPKNQLALIILGIALLVMGYLALMDTIKTKLAITDTSIEVQRGFTFRTINRSDVKGYSQREKGRMAIVSKTNGIKDIMLPPYLGRESHLKEWLMENYPDVDELVKEAETKDILDNEEFGFTKDDREFMLKRAKLVGRVGSGIGLIAGLWAWFYARPYNEGMIVLLILPLIGIFIIRGFKGLIRFNESRKSAYPSLSLLFLFVILGGGIRMVLDFHIDSFEHFWPIFIVTSVVLTLFSLYMCNAVIKAENKKALIILFIAFFSMAYSAFAIVFSNYYLDRSSPQLYKAEILSKRVSGGRSTTYYLSLGKWGHYDNGEEVSVPRLVYNAVNTGDAVNITMREGKWHIPWFDISAP